jgi:VIT1/CCC1 family predicted Fe2+/Mn2+ transporter
MALKKRLNKEELEQIRVEDAIIASEEFQKNSMSAKLNWLRAGVLGANDGIVSTAGLVMGVAGANPDNTGAIFIAGVAGLVAGSISMAGGEYTSVSAQRDSEIAMLNKERQELIDDPAKELRELIWFYEQKGLSFETAELVANELTAKDALRAHAEAELGIDPDQHVSPTHAAVASLIAFAAGSILPLLAITSFSKDSRIWATVIAVALSLALTGYVGAKIGGAKSMRAIIRNVTVSLLTMGITYGIGFLLGTGVA